VCEEREAAAKVRREGTKVWSETEREEMEMGTNPKP